MPDVELNKANEAHSRTDIHAEGFGFNHDFVFSADASTNTSGPLPSIDGLRGRGRGLRFGVIGWTEQADPSLPIGGLAAVVGTGHNANATQDAAGILGVSNSHEGVFGWSDNGRGVKGLSADVNSTGEGVYGEGQKGAGVKGHANNGGDGVIGEAVIAPGAGAAGRGVFGTSRNNHGVHGESDESDGVFGFSKPGRGVVGSSERNHGVHGESRGNHAVFGDNGKNPPQGSLFQDAPTGCYGVTRQNRAVAGVVGREGIDANNPADIGAFATAVYGSSEHHTRRNRDGRTVVEDKGIAGLFWGPVFVLGNFIATGPIKSGAVRQPDGSHRLVYSMESPESWFEDFGEARLVRGKTRVKIRADFAAIVDTKSYQVFITPYGDCAGLYVSARAAKYFDVREHGGTTRSVAFAYRIVARPRHSDHKRLAKINLPKLPQPPRGSKPAR